LALCPPRASSSRPTSHTPRPPPTRPRSWASPCPASSSPTPVRHRGAQPPAPTAGQLWCPCRFQYLPPLPRGPAACWMGWPTSGYLWREMAKPAQEQYAGIAIAISQFEPLKMVASPGAVSPKQWPNSLPAAPARTANQCAAADVLWNELPCRTLTWRGPTSRTRPTLKSSRFPSRMGGCAIGGLRCVRRRAAFGRDVCKDWPAAPTERRE
jgi:hypothetical protein